MSAEQLRAATDAANAAIATAKAAYVVALEGLKTAEVNYVNAQTTAINALRAEHAEAVARLAATR